MPARGGDRITLALGLSHLAQGGFSARRPYSRPFFGKERDLQGMRTNVEIRTWRFYNAQAKVGAARWKLGTGQAEVLGYLARQQRIVEEEWIFRPQERYRRMASPL